MTSRAVVSLDAAHAAAATAIEQLYDEAMSHLDAVLRSFGAPERDAGEPQQDTSSGPATLELPRRITPPASTTQAA